MANFYILLKAFKYLWDTTLQRVYQQIAVPTKNNFLSMFDKRKSYSHKFWTPQIGHSSQIYEKF